MGATELVTPITPITGFHTEPAVGRETEAAAVGVARRSTLRRDTRYRRILMVADVIATGAAVGAGYQVSAGRFSPESLAFPLGSLIAAKIVGLYDRDAARVRKSTLDEVPRLFELATLMTLALWMASQSLMGREFRPENAIVVWATMFASLVSFRLAGRAVACHFTPAERCLFVGPPDAAAQFQGKLDHDRAANATLIGRVDLDAALASSAGSPLDIADTRELVERLNIHRVVIAPESFNGDHVLHLMRSFEAIGVRVTIIPAILQVVGSAVEFDDLQGLSLMGVRSFRLTRSSQLSKRAFDLLGAAVAIAFVGPLMLGIALAIKLESPGPILFRQRRVGQGGRGFRVFKFRTMVADAEARKVELLSDNQAADGFFKIADDPRITRVGRFLRRTCLDELPQLLNVLRGEMSLVGPRPLIPEEDARVVGWHRRRLELMPGMTGHWQVLGSSRVPLREMVAIDYLYVANWSLWVDLKLMLRTVPHILGRRGL